MSYESEVKERLTTKSEEAFADWLATPLVRHTMKAIRSDGGALPDLLRSAFDAGTASGVGVAMIEMLKMMGTKPQ